MAKFLVKDRMACWVTWKYVIDADTEEEATALFRDSEYDQEAGYEIGYAIDYCPGETTITKMPHIDGFYIRAEVHSDDYAEQVSFDAAPWFAQASDEEIVALAGCEWGGGLPSRCRG